MDRWMSTIVWKPTTTFLQPSSFGTKMSKRGLVNVFLNHSWKIIFTNEETRVQLPATYWQYLCKWYQLIKAIRWADYIKIWSFHLFFYLILFITRSVCLSRTYAIKILLKISIKIVSRPLSYWQLPACTTCPKCVRPSVLQRLRSLSQSQLVLPSMAAVNAP